MSGPVIGSLFSGYGGLDMAVAAVLGGRVAWHCEWDDNPSKILAHHWPSIPNHRDITKVQWTPHCPDCGELVALYDRSGDGVGGRFYYCATCATEKPLSIRDAEPWVPEPVDVLTGGFPCQDVSHAGRRAGLIRDGEGRTRSGLWGEMLKAIDTLRPRLVVAENVRGLLSATADSDVEPCTFCMGDEPGSPMRALGAVLADLADVGYDAAWVGLPASGVGAPHGRFRVFILAWPRVADTDSDVLRQQRRAPSFQKAGTHEGDRPANPGGGHRPELTLLGTPRAADGMHSPMRDPDAIIGAGRGRLEDQIALLKTPTSQLAVNGGSQHPDKRRGGGHGPTLADEVEHLLPTPAVNDMGRAYTPEEWDAWTEKMRAAHGNGNGHGASLHVEALRMLPTPVVTDANGARNETSGRQPGAVFASGRTLGDVTYLDAFGEYALAIARWEHVLGRAAPAPTEPTGKGGAHRLSPRFVEWMMGLPDGHVTDVPDLSRNAQLKALGNGVVPQQAAAALEWLLRMRATYATTGG